MIRILVADDQALVRAGFCALIEATVGLQVVAEAADGTEAVDLAARHEPDLVLMDIRMPRLDGISATWQLLALPRPPHVLILRPSTPTTTCSMRSRPGPSAFWSRTPRQRNSSRQSIRQCAEVL